MMMTLALAKPLGKGVSVACRLFVLSVSKGTGKHIAD